jgi:hypothetical protein
MNLREGTRRLALVLGAAGASLGAIITVGCNVQRPIGASATPKQEEHSPRPADGTEQRFAFPSQPTPFPAASVAMDTKTGRLCKTYPWPDTKTLPSGLPLCSGGQEPSNDGGAAPIIVTAEDMKKATADPSMNGATKAYRGDNYVFDGSKWKKDGEAQKYNRGTQRLESRSDDQYDPLNLFSKEEKAKRLLTEEQIRSVAKQFGVSFQDALQDAKEQGYQVPK